MIRGLPDKLQVLRLQYGYSQKTVAQKLKMLPSIVSAYETGERTPSAGVLLSLSYVYNCSTDYLLGKQTSELNKTLDISGLTDEQARAMQLLIDSIKSN